MSETWKAKHAALLGRAKEMRARSVVSRQELVDLQTEIRALERQVDRPLPEGMLAGRIVPAPRPERSGRMPTGPVGSRPRPECPVGSCDGTGWILRDSEDVADPCGCRRLRRGRAARRQNRRILRRHLALGLDSPPLSELDPRTRRELKDYTLDIEASVRSGRGFWLPGSAGREEVCVFLAGEAIRRDIATLVYPVDELIGRLRRLAAQTGGRKLEDEIYGTLADVEFLVLLGLDDAADPRRYPEPALDRDALAGRGPEDPPPGGDTPEADLQDPASDRAVATYLPAMTDVDLGRLAEVIDQRWMAERSTVVSTACERGELEERLLRVAGWPDAEKSAGSTEPHRRAVELRRLLSRLDALGAPSGPAELRIPSGAGTILDEHWNPRLLRSSRSTSALASGRRATTPLQSSDPARPTHS